MSACRLEPDLQGVEADRRYQGQDTGCSCEDPSVLRIFLFQLTSPFTLSLSEYYKEILTDKIIILWGSPGAPW